MGILSDITDSLGLTDSGAADRGIAAQTRAVEKANEIHERIYNDSVARLQPYQERGQQAFSKLSDLANVNQRFSNVDSPLRNHNGQFSMEDFKSDPGYNFRLREGQKGIERSAAARGATHSGSSLKALAKYSQGLASQEYSNAYNRFNQDYSNAYTRFNSEGDRGFNRLNAIANYGQNANSSLSNQGMNYATSVGGNHMGVGNSIASAELNRGNDIKDLWNMGASAFGAYMGGK